MRKFFPIIRSILLSLPGGRSLYNIISNWREERRKVRDRRILQKSGLDLLRLVHSRLHGKIQYFIDYGTLLGYVRDSAFIKHDDDVDFGIMPETNPADVIEAFEGTELEYCGCYVYDGAVREIGYKYRKMRVDFFVNSLDGEDFQADAFYDINGRDYGKNETGCFRFTRPAVKRLVTVNFCGVAVDAPENAEELLAAHYGPGWRTPDAKWTAKDGVGQYKRVPMPGIARHSVGKEEAIGICRTEKTVQ